MVKTLFAAMLCLSLLSCGHQTYRTVDVAKPRIHHSWYKHHVHRRKIGVGRIRIHLFEKQGTKTVKMKG